MQVIMPQGRAVTEVDPQLMYGSNLVSIPLDVLLK